MKRLLCIAWLALLCGACGGDDEGTVDGGAADGGATADSGTAPTASVQINPSTGQIITGTGQFTVSGGAVSFTLNLTQAPPGEHGIHIHDVGDCGMDGMAAGDHWNPEGGDHGMPGADPSHYGDMGNLTVATDGTATLQISKPEWKIGDGSTGDVVGHAVIVHAMADDFGQPLGNAGARIGCGVIASP
jgi:Cu-Zn family superoxide dismutase